MFVKPESAIPPSARAARLAARRRSKAARKSTQAAAAAPGAAAASASPPTRGFAIQIKPHDNGEIFLSVTAALQNPSFFGWPFSGRTTPKRASNPSYPQRTPDPVVNITVYGAGQQPVLALTGYNLNTVYYERKSEIRITASPLIGIVPDYSVMIMELSDTPDVAYEITIHRPDSPDYVSWVAACNQTMPSGGSAPRHYGWF
jgi:hypothetical protein